MRMRISFNNVHILRQCKYISVFWRKHVPGALMLRGRYQRAVRLALMHRV